jgi:hypothetical protein
MRILAALSLSILLAGCGLLDRLQNHVILVATLLQSPQPPPGIGGSAVAAAQVYLAQKSGDLTSPPSEQSLTPITGATVALLDNGTRVATLTGVAGAPGYYESTSAAYVAGHTYRFTASVGSDQYWAEVASVPATPTLTLPGTAASGVYTYTNYSNTGAFPDPYPIGRSGTDIAFYSVWGLSGTTFDPTATPNCTNFPKTAGDFLTLVFVNDAPYRAATFSVPKATCFPEPLPASFPAKYLVGLAAVKRGATSGNLSIYSGAVAGTSAAAGVFVTLP